MKTLLVLAHPRKNSLTAAVADIFAAGLEKNEHEVEWANLVEEGFDPVLREEDEPDGYEARNTRLQCAARWIGSSATMLRSWCSRSTGGRCRACSRDGSTASGTTAGPTAMPASRATACLDDRYCRNTASGFASRGYDSAMSAQLDLGVLDYCGVQERRLELLHGSIEGESYVDRILLDAESLASEY